jgi:beta-N-acetylhexosaminidase
MTGVRGPGSGSRGNPWLVCGIAGMTLDAEERSLLEEVRPGGIVLFARNVADCGQLAALVRELLGLPSRPYVAIDLEGGRVNRLQGLLGPLPPAAQAARAGILAVRTLAEAAAAACAHFGIGVDFAPVVDVAWPEGWLGSEARCLGSVPAQVQAAAAAYLQGLESFGVSGCLKHYPGLGSGAVDSHRELPLLDDCAVEDAAVFRALAAPGRAVMVAHALAPALGEAACPASLSRTVVAPLRAVAAPLVADDLEMGALSAYGAIPERAAAALGAGCDQVLLCNALAARGEVVEHVADAAGRDPVLAAILRESEARAAGFGRGVLSRVSWDEVLELAERARALAGAPA